MELFQISRQRNHCKNKKNRQNVTGDKNLDNSHCSPGSLNLGHWQSIPILLVAHLLTSWTCQSILHSKMFKILTVSKQQNAGIICTRVTYSSPATAACPTKNSCLNLCIDLAPKFADPISERKASIFARACTTVVGKVQVQMVDGQSRLAHCLSPSSKFACSHKRSSCKPLGMYI